MKEKVKKKKKTPPNSNPSTGYILKCNLQHTKNLLEIINSKVEK